MTATPALPQIPIMGSDQTFTLGRIFCVGRNYAAHAREMGNDPDRSPPVFFTKFPNAYAPSGSVLVYPPRTENWHYEVELAVAIAKGGANIAPAKALEHVLGYSVALDMTKRDLQKAAKEAGSPWDMAKNAPLSAPMGALTPSDKTGTYDTGAITLKVNGEVRQSADISDMIWPVPDIIAELSTYGALAPGDLILTGTPAGVGPVQPGDELLGEIEGLSPLNVKIAATA